MRFGLLGAKLKHSISPQIHNLIFRELAIEGKYDLLEVKKCDLDYTMQHIAEKYAGVNITIPYKVEVMQNLTAISPEAKAIGAVNTVHFIKGEKRGYNTDYFGFGKLLKHNDITLEDKDVVVLGSGGAARAVLQYLVDNYAKSITIASRRPDEVINSFFDFKILPKLSLINYAQLAARSGGDIIVNTTPVGMYPSAGESPVSQKIVAGYGTVVDLIYNPAETLLMRYGKASGCKTCNGFYMLVAQAVAAEEIWLEREIDAKLIISIAQEIQGV